MLGYNRNLRIVNVYKDGPFTHVVIDTTTSNRGMMRRQLLAGNVQVLTGPSSTNTGMLRPLCRPTYIRQGQVFNVASTVKSMR